MLGSAPEAIDETEYPENSKPESDGKIEKFSVLMAQFLFICPESKGRYRQESDPIVAQMFIVLDFLKSVLFFLQWRLLDARTGITLSMFSYGSLSNVHLMSGPKCGKQKWIQVL